jgi:hypothetical protein
MKSAEEAPAYSIGKGRRTFKLSEQDQRVPGPASYTVDLEFNKEAPIHSMPKAPRLKERRRSLKPGPGAYDIPVTIGPLSEGKAASKTFSGHSPVIKNSPKTK